jgi:dTDP-4-dehydrorhamnose 3,5-epimerase
MIFEPLALAGAFLVHLERIEDERGWNARMWCVRELEEQGLASQFVQSNAIHNRRRGTVRGMHYQIPPMADAKLFSVVSGSIYDVIVDLREDSRTWGEWASVELHAGDDRLLYVPRGFGQGFQTLEDDTDLIYSVTAFHSPEHSRGFRHDDPAFAIAWPLPVSTISDKDRRWSDYGEGS